MRLDDRYELVAGVFGRDAEASAAVAAELHLDPARVYRDHEAMIAAERARADGVDLVVIATPNDSHHLLARAVLDAGFHVVCEKPLTKDAATSADLVAAAAANDVVLAVPHCYSAYPMVREAARLVREGRLGELRFVDVEHASGWAATPLEQTGHKQASWRTDPDVAGFPSVVADLGTHAYHLVRYITGRDAEQVSAQLHTFVPGRRVFDNATVQLRLAGDVPGRLWASMAATGRAHGLRISVYGSEASLEWQHEDPHHLTVRDLDATATTYFHGQSVLSEDSNRLTRIGLGHPEGFIEAFANFYRDLADELQARWVGASALRELGFPTGIDGLRGVEFVEAVARSAASDASWQHPHPTKGN
jgi:predicted dehydrogenase